ncbi:hypothetical protein BT69DRAFT_1298329 [Atractiella rhizophila]|nr:hypothetical protein BT69DRAFT_1298329 [Atractiella rhizophila]
MSYHCSYRTILTAAKLLEKRQRQPPLPQIKDVPSFIQACNKNRKLVTYVPKFEDVTLEDFLKMDGEKLEKLTGMSLKERKYLLRVMERYRQGAHPTQVAVPLKPPKKIRGWGPKIQFGKRVR